MQATVSIRTCEDYDPARLRATLESALEDLARLLDTDLLAG